MRNATLTGRTKLPTLEQFSDKRINGLRQILGGARNYNTSDGGQYDLGDGTRDYVADAYDRDRPGSSIHGFCSHFQSAQEFFNSQYFQAWVNDF